MYWTSQFIRRFFLCIHILTIETNRSQAYPPPAMYALIHHMLCSSADTFASSVFIALRHVHHQPVPSTCLGPLRWQAELYLTAGRPLRAGQASPHQRCFNKALMSSLGDRSTGQPLAWPAWQYVPPSLGAWKVRHLKWLDIGANLNKTDEKAELNLLTKQVFSWVTAVWTE